MLNAEKQYSFKYLMTIGNQNIFKSKFKGTDAYVLKNSQVAERLIDLANSEHA